MGTVVVTNFTSLDGVIQSRRLGDDLPGEVSALTRELDGEIVVFGSGELVRELAAHDLVDEYRLLLFPLVLGSGKRMFADGLAPSRFTLVSAAPTTTGVVLLTHRRAVD